MVGSTWPQEEDGTRRVSWQKVGHYSPHHPGDRSLSSIRQTTNHQRTMTEGIQRPPPTPTRWRSNTAVPDQLDLAGRPSLIIQTDGRGHDRRPVSVNLHSRNESSGSIKRTLKSKASRLLRRQGSNSNLTSLKTIDWSDQLDESPWTNANAMSSRHQSRRPQTASSSSDTEESPIRHIISLPFDFRHLTHTNDNDFRGMQDVPTESLKSEFSTLRRSHVPKGELQGIKAETISRHDHPPETSTPSSSASSRSTTPHRPTGSVPRKTSPQIPFRPENPWGTDDMQDSRVQGRYTPSRNPPSLPRLDEYDSSSDWQPSSILPETFTPPDSPAYDTFVDTTVDNVVAFPTPHAVTTPDDVAHSLQPPPAGMVRTGLSRVIEEDEFSDRRSSIATLTQRPSTADSALRHTKSFPSSNQADNFRTSTTEIYRQSVQTSPKRQRRSVKIIQPSFDDVDGDVPYQARLSRRVSATVKDVDGNWDDVIDWCYDHEAEADCNFDFKRAVSPTPHSPTAESESGSTALLHSTAFALGKSERRSSSVYSASPPFLPQLRTSVVPELEPPSAVSTQSSFESTSEAMTPKTTYSTNDTRFPTFSTKPNYSKPIVHHTPHVSNDMTPPDLYENLCVETYARESWHYGRAEGSVISSISPRSSHSPISKSSSQESFNLRRRRSNNNSQASLPELIPSRLSRERTDHPAESAQITDHLTTSTTDESSRRKSPTSLVKDVAQKNLILKLQNGTIIEDACSAEVPLPLHPALRGINSTGSGFENQEKDNRRATLAPSSPIRDTMPTRPPMANRMRSASSAANLKGSAKGGVNISPRASRASYGLYPTTARR